MAGVFGDLEEKMGWRDCQWVKAVTNVTGKDKSAWFEIGNSWFQLLAMPDVFQL